MRLGDKVAIVTGSSKGIGRAIALEFGKEGAKVVTNDRKLKGSEKTADEIVANGGVAIAVRADVSKKKDVDRMIKQVVKRFGRIDVLVNNAGIVRFDPITKVSEKEWDKVLDVNLKGTFLCSQAVAKTMLKQKSGVIINIASIAGMVGFPQLAPYCASKGGIIELTRELAIELAPNKIRVNCIGPGAIDTDMTKSIKEDKKSMKSYLAKIPLARLGKPEEIAKAALFLASDDSSYMTGQAIFVDGGWLAR